MVGFNPQKIHKTDQRIQKFEKIMLQKTVDECYDIFNDFGITNTIRVIDNDTISESNIPDRINVKIENNRITEIVNIG